MSATQKPAAGDADAQELSDGLGGATPDEDGPHDVPDEKVIEKTLPAKPLPEGGGRAR